jgi:hypothetical protein
VKAQARIEAVKAKASMIVMTDSAPDAVSSFLTLRSWFFVPFTCGLACFVLTVACRGSTHLVVFGFLVDYRSKGAHHSTAALQM